MFKSQCLLLCFCYSIIGSNAAATPFIDKCSWDDKACLITSSQKALPFFAAGISELGMPPLDPLHIKTVSLNEGGLNVVFNDLTVTETRKCQVVDVERNIDEKWLKFAAECPIDVTGSYVASGKLIFAPIEGEGPFHVQTDKILITIKVELTEVDGKDGQKHWSLGNYEHDFDVKEKAVMHFENLFNGDQTKAAPIEQIFDQSWKDIIQSFGKPIVFEVVKDVVEVIKKFTEKVSASELQN